MATEKKITPRIQQKHDVAANWAKATNFIPKKGEIIIYDAEYNASGEETQPVRFKIGDGSKTVNNLPFAAIDYSSDIETLEQKVANNSTAIDKIQGAFETNDTTVKKATSAGTADKVANGLTLGGGVVYDGSKALSIMAGNKMLITGYPGGVSIGLGYSVMPSTYNKVTVDGYGTVTAGENVDYLTSHQSIKSINTNNTAAQTVNASEAIAGSGTINLHKVAKTGSYNDLLYKPTIPAAANNGTLTIQKNGTDVATFTANQSSPVTANITVPTKTSQLTNDSNFVKSNSGAFTGNLTADNFNSRFSLQSVPYGTAVGENANLNTVTYLSVGNYYCGADAIVSTMTNVPVKRAFMMTVYSPLTPTVDNEPTGKWVYRVRKFMTYLGEEYIQSVYSGDTAGTFTYNAWQQIAHKSDIPTFSLSGKTLTITL